MSEESICDFSDTSRPSASTFIDVAWSIFQTASTELAGFAPSSSDLRGAAAGSSIQLARRVLVLGSSGAGKTHLSSRLGAILGLDVIHLDDHFWQPGYRPREEREWRKMVTEMTGRDSWIMDGTYERSLDLRIPRADAIVLLECHRMRCLGRVLRRQADGWIRSHLEQRHDGSDRFDANHIRYVWHYPTVTRPAVFADIGRYGRGKPVVLIDGPEGVGAFLSSLGAKPSVAAN
jgi:adenylate kinase family enzyme